MKYVKFTSFDNTILQAYVWDDVKMPKGVVQIVHGMAEHARRYDDFAKFLNANGYIVFADDHRAHGNTEKKNDIGYHAGDIYGDSVKDELFITKYLSEKYALPVVFLGHSYGSFIGQRYLENDSDAVGVILSGSARQPGVVVGAGKFFSNTITKMKANRRKANLWTKSLSAVSTSLAKKKDTTLPGFRATSIRSKSTATTNNADTSCPTTSINAL